MGKQKGRAYLIKIGDGADPVVFSAFTGLTAKTFKINNERIDVTTPGTDPNAAIWRETLDGVKSVSLTGDYTVVKEVPEARLVTVAMSVDATDDFQVVIPGIGTFEGVFSVEIEFSEDGAAKGAMSLESTGAVTFTPEA